MTPESFSKAPPPVPADGGAEASTAITIDMLLDRLVAHLRQTHAALRRARPPGA